MISLLLLALATFIGAMIMSAGPRIEAENDSIMRLSKEFVETAVESLQGTVNPKGRLEVLLDGLKNLRHVRIYRAGKEAQEAEAEKAKQIAEGEAPAWLARMGDSGQKIEIPVVVNGQNFGHLVIAPEAIDESAEIWDSIVKFTVVGTGLAIAMLVFMSLMIAHLLRPIRMLGQALLRLDSGSFDVRVPETGPPEITDISSKLNRLANTLQTTTAENGRLTKRIIRIQDEERKELARELHDELGPYLFALRAGASMLRTDAERGAPKDKLVRTSETLLERIETMQAMNRRVLHKLRPIGLDEFGLKAKLTSLAGMWRENHPDVRIDLKVPDDMAKPDETSNLTLYRIVQEGLTNAFRHADATEIEVVVEPWQAGVTADAREAPLHERADTVRRGGDGSRAWFHVTVTDNGRGLAEQLEPSYGIAGMNERVWATGGEMRIFNRPGGGVTLEAWVPATAGVADISGDDNNATVA
jgi:two-component system sensor histidine kinase UhpB